jgi:plasmid stabilization system protein ParE
MTRTRTISLEVSEEAARAIIDQALYYREQSPDSALAAKWDDAVTQAALSLLQMPDRGSDCHFQSSRLRGMRRISVPGFPKHLVFYIFVQEARIVRIVHVLHGARDLETFLFDVPE